MREVCFFFVNWPQIYMRERWYKYYCHALALHAVPSTCIVHPVMFRATINCAGARKWFSVLCFTSNSIWEAGCQQHHNHMDNLSCVSLAAAQLTVYTNKTLCLRFTVTWMELKWKRLVMVNCSPLQILKEHFFPRSIKLKV